MSRRIRWSFERDAQEEPDAREERDDRQGPAGALDPAFDR